MTVWDVHLNRGSGEKQLLEWAAPLLEAAPLIDRDQYRRSDPVL